jgi:ribosomal protein S18 acetylase RimI-like enzyme
VNKHNLGAIGLYDKLGFKVVRNVGSSEQLMAFYRV